MFAINSDSLGDVITSLITVVDIDRTLDKESTSYNDNIVRKFYDENDVLNQL